MFPHAVDTFDKMPYPAASKAKICGEKLGASLQHSPRQAHVSFRVELRQWLESHHNQDRDRDDFRAWRAWNATLFDAGYAAPAWPG